MSSSSRQPMTQPPANPAILKLMKRARPVPQRAAKARRMAVERPVPFGVLSEDSNYQRDLQRRTALDDHIRSTKAGGALEPDAEEMRTIRDKTFTGPWVKLENKICLGNLRGKPPRRSEFEGLSEATVDATAPLTDAPTAEELVRQEGPDAANVSALRGEEDATDPKKRFLYQKRVENPEPEPDVIPLDRRLVLRHGYCRDILQRHDESLASAESLIKKFAKERLIEENMDMTVLQTIFMSNASADGLQEMDVEMPDGETVRRVLPYHVQSVAGGEDRVPDVRINCRAFEEDVLLRSAVPEWGERRCLKEDRCEGMLLPVAKQSPLREVVWQEEWEHFCETGAWSHVQAGESRRLCLLCCRKSAVTAYFVAKASMMSMNSHNHMLLRFYNVADLPGEYPASCLIWNTGKEYLGLYGPVVHYCVHDYASKLATVTDKHKSYKVVRFSQPNVPQVGMDGVNRFEAGLASGGAGDQYYYDSFTHQRRWHDIVPGTSRFLDSSFLADPDRVMVQVGGSTASPPPPDGPIYEEPGGGGGGDSFVFDIPASADTAGMSRVNLDACALEIGGAYVVDTAEGPRLRLERPIDVLCSDTGEIRGVRMPVSLSDDVEKHNYMDASTNPEDVRLDMLMRAGTSVPWEDTLMPESGFVDAMLAEEAELEAAANAANSSRRSRRKRASGRGVTAAAATTRTAVGTSYRELSNIESSVTARRRALIARRLLPSGERARTGEALAVNHTLDTILATGVADIMPLLVTAVGERAHYQSALRNFAARPFFFVDQADDVTLASGTVTFSEEGGAVAKSKSGRPTVFRPGKGRQRTSKREALKRAVKERTTLARFGNSGSVGKHAVPAPLKSMYVKNNKRRGKDRASSLMRHQEAVVRQSITAEQEAEGAIHLRRYMSDAGVQCATTAVAKLPTAGEWIEHNTAHHYKVPSDAHSRHKSRDQRPFTGKPRFEIRKINPYVCEESGHFREDTPPVQVYRMLERDLGLTLPEAVEWFPDWVAGEFSRHVRPWLCEGVEYQAYTWYPVRLHDNNNIIAGYSIYCTLVSRIHALDEMQRRANVHHKLRVQLCLWQDTHQLLALFMETTGFFHDDQLRAPADFAYIQAAVRRGRTEGEGEAAEEEEEEELPEWAGRFRSLLDEALEDDTAGPTYADVFRPSLAHIMHEGELPDLSKPMMYVPFWQETEDKHSGILDLDVELMMEIIGKALPRPQQSRDMYQITARRIDRYARYKDCITRWLAMSQMGLYESTGARVISNFYVRHEVYRTLSFTPTSPSDLARWMNGFECEDLSRENLARSARGRGSGGSSNSGGGGGRRNASVGDPVTGLTEDGRFSSKLAPVYAVTSDWESGEVERVETRGMYEINPKLLVGNNEPKARAGFCNMTSHTQFMITEFLVMLINANPGMRDALGRFYAFEDVYGEMVEDMDNIRRIYNAFFVADAMPEHVRHSYADYAPAGGQRPLLGGRSYLRAMVRTFVPYLDWACMDECVSLMSEPRRNLTFQQSIMPSGVVGDTLWNARTMILAEALLYCCRKRTLPLWSCYMQVPFRRHALAQFTEIEVRVGKRGGKELADMIAAERAIPKKHREKIDHVITYVLGHGRPRKTPSYEWMAAAFDLTMRPLLFLALTERHYREENFSKTVANTIRRIYETFPREFQYVKYFLRTLEREASIFVYDLPRSVTVQQARTLHESHALVARGEPLPANADLAWYCPAHLDFKHPLADEHPDTPFHRGTVHTVVCPWTYELLCKFENIATSSRKRGRPEDAAGEEEDEDGDSVVRRVYTNHDSNLETQACARLRLRRVHMLGKVLRLKHDFFVACPFCWTYTFLSLDKFNTRLGFACPSCASAINRNVSYRIEDYYRFRCVQCTDTALYKVNQVHRHVVYDDTRKDRAPYYRVAYFCRTHNRRFIGESATTTSLSNIQMYLGRRVYPKRIQNERGEWDYIFIAEASLERCMRALLDVAQKVARRKRREADDAAAL